MFRTIGAVQNPVIITPDGSSVLFYAHFDCNGTALKTLGPVCGLVEVDIDGPNKGKGVLGIDQFLFLLLLNNGFIPKYGSDNNEGGSSYNYPQHCFSYTNGGHYRYEGCTQWVIDNGNMDYLKVDASGKCPDGKTILDGVSNITCK